MLRRHFLRLTTTALALPVLRAAEAHPWAELARPGRALLLRHATAPGVGDPRHFVLGDCTTQRNLSAAGRREAAELGASLRDASIGISGVLTSEWCRAQETAERLGLGPVTVTPALNSFFAAPEHRRERMDALREVLRALPREAPLVILVTHQVNITALTGHYPASLGGSLLALEDAGDVRVLQEWRGPGRA